MRSVAFKKRSLSQPIAFFICFKVKNDNVKALFFDIDGTLVSFKTHQIPQSTVDAIAQAKANGVGVLDRKSVV